MLIRLQNGSPLWKVSKHWCLEEILENFQSIIQGVSSLIPSHVTREANKFVDYLANDGVSSSNDMIDSN
jgi:hypothetical protein